jgi:hypothetical protein
VNKLRFFLYCYEQSATTTSISRAGDDFRDLDGCLADVTGDDKYRRMLGDRDITSYWPLAVVYLFYPEVSRCP